MFLKKIPDFVLVLMPTSFIVALILCSFLFNGSVQVALPSRMFANLSALMNLATLGFLMIGRHAVLRSNPTRHVFFMRLALVSSFFFLLFYLGQHFLFQEIKYPKDAPFRALYLFLLATHILSSGIVLPMILTTAMKAIRADFQNHKRWARITFWPWVYVSVSGIVVFLMLRPYVLLS